MKLISSKLTSLVSLEQSQLKPNGRYRGGLLRLPLGEPHLPPSANLRRPPTYLPIGFSWDCSNDTRLVSL